jgi:hypothetical protein
MLNVDNVLAEKAKKLEMKKAKIEKLKEASAKMKPFELFVGVKDNPLPYEKRHQKM